MRKNSCRKYRAREERKEIKKVCFQRERKGGRDIFKREKKKMRKIIEAC